MTARTPGILGEDMILKWQCPFCDKDSSLQIFRRYNTMRVYSICGQCDGHVLVCV